MPERPDQPHRASPASGAHHESDDLRDLFAPLRTETTASAGEIARVRSAATAGRPSRTRRRWLLSGTSVGVAAGVAVVLVLAIDRGRPGTFVGEAGARELLRAAANASRDEPAQHGWRWSTTVRVERTAFSGRRCRACATERGVLETRSTQERWDGPRGETYTLDRQARPRAVENTPLLRAQHALAVATPPTQWRGTHVEPVGRGAKDDGTTIGFSTRGGIADPGSLPEDPGGLVRWVEGRLHAQDRELRVREARGHGRIRSTISWGTRVSYALVDLATSPQLSGGQRAAAFEALAERPGVTAATPTVFAAPERVAVRIVARSPAGTDVRRLLDPLDRVIVFDRGTHRVIAEEARDARRGGAQATFWFGEGRHPGRLRRIDGGGGETRYGVPVDVPGPGLDAEGRRRMALTGVLELDRNGRGRPPGRRGG